MTAADVRSGRSLTTHHPHLVNLHGCEIGDECRGGTYVEIRREVNTGCNVKVQAFGFIREGVTVKEGVFRGHHVRFANDRYPRGANPDGSLAWASDWEFVPTHVKRGAIIGASAALLCDVATGEYAILGAGTLSARGVPAGAVVRWRPARVVNDVRCREEWRSR